MHLVLLTINALCISRGSVPHANFYGQHGPGDLPKGLEKLVSRDISRFDPYLSVEELRKA